MTVGTDSDSTQPRASSPTTRRSTWRSTGSREPTTHDTDAMPIGYNVRAPPAHNALFAECIAELALALPAPRHCGCAQPRARRIEVARPTARGRADAAVGRPPRDVPRPRTQIRACRVSATPRCSRDPFIKCFAQLSRAEHKTVCMRSISFHLLVVSSYNFIFSSDVPRLGNEFWGEWGA